jgi:hypothetical protein
MVCTKFDWNWPAGSGEDIFFLSSDVHLPRVVSYTRSWFLVLFSIPTYIMITITYTGNLRVTAMHTLFKKVYNIQQENETLTPRFTWRNKKYIFPVTWLWCTIFNCDVVLRIVIFFSENVYAFLYSYLRRKLNNVF